MTSLCYRDPDSMSKVGNNREQYLATSHLHIYTNVCMPEHIPTPPHMQTHRDTCVTHVDAHEKNYIQ